jgi:hypothetical protein
MAKQDQMVEEGISVPIPPDLWEKLTIAAGGEDQVQEFAVTIVMAELLKLAARRRLKAYEESRREQDVK